MVLSQCVCMCMCVYDNCCGTQPTRRTHISIRMLDESVSFHAAANCSECRGSLVLHLANCFGEKPSFHQPYHCLLFIDSCSACLDRGVIIIIQEIYIMCCYSPRQHKILLKEKKKTFFP